MARQDLWTWLLYNLTATELVFCTTHGVVRLSAGRLHNALQFPAAGDG